MDCDVSIPRVLRELFIAVATSETLPKILSIP